MSHNHETPRRHTGGLHETMTLVVRSLPSLCLSTPIHYHDRSFVVPLRWFPAIFRLYPILVPPI
jgi:hypothetical protein